MSIMPDINRGFSAAKFISGNSHSRTARRGQAQSLVEVFRARALEDAARVGFTYLREDETAAETVTYSQLDARACSIAGQLQAHCRPGDRALLMYGPGLEFIAALAGCLYAGVVAVPVYPPDPLRVARTLPRLESIIRDAQSRLVLGTSSDLAWAGAMLGKIPGVDALIATDEIETRTIAATNWAGPRLDRQTLAFIQYTSGSTGEPKGVMIQHGNVLQNMIQMEAAIDVEDAVAATWLPAYHDMGLIGSILQCWYSGRPNVMMSPLAFFQRPIFWLETIAKYRATTTGAPNFAYELCVRKTTAEERQNLDLSCWRLAMSGAEPVRPDTIERFLEAFAPSGVRRDIFKPCFGMAEATLMVACTPKSEPARIGSFDAEQLAENNVVETSDDQAAVRRLASCGQSVLDQELLIVDPETLDELPADHVGEIWIAGRHIASGYWNQPEESERTFAAHTRSGRGPFLRTGDAGFLHDGDLFISGRLKEMMIVHGRNYFPADLEQTAAAAHEALKGCCGAAFAVETGGRERIVIVHEVARPNRVDLEEVSRIVRWEVLDAHDVLLDTVVLVRRGTIPKTTSGKIQRGACHELFLARELQPLHCWKAPHLAASANANRPYAAPRTPTESLLADAWSEVLGLEKVGVFDNFMDLGGHSLLAAQLANRLGPRLGIEIPLRELFERPTIADLAELIDQRQAAQAKSEQDFLDQLESMSDDEALAMLSFLEEANPPSENSDNTTS